MWILESNGDFLRGKRMWLKPGKKYLFGRVKKDGVNLAIDHKTVSRKHFLVTIGEVQGGDAGNVHARTTIAVEDLASKAGTNVDGELISGASKILKQDVTSIRPGSCPHELIITWVPCVLTYGLNKKELKNGVLQEKQERLKDLDIKVVNEYLSGLTTHMISQKRNTPRTLQALIEGKPLVNEAFVDDLIYASNPSDLEIEESFSSLESDFEAGWPDESKYLPPAGKEPTTKPDSAYSPNPERARIFEKHTFFFFDQGQYDLLLPPVTVGHGKGLFFEIKEKTSKVEDALKFIRNAVGRSGTAVIVKPNEQEESWRGNFVEKLCVKFGQLSTEQAALLDAILANDASSLHKPLHYPNASGGPVRTVRKVVSPEEQAELDPHQLPSQSKPLNGVQTATRSSSSSLSPVPESAAISQHANTQEAAETSQTSQQSMAEDANPRPRKRARFAPILETVKAFDDDFDPRAAVPYEDNEDEVEEVVESPPKPSSARVSQISRASTTKARIKEEPVSTPRRQGTPDSFADESDDGMDDLLPGAAAMSREKKEAEARAIREGRPLKIDKPAKAEAISKSQKKPKLIDVREASRAKRDADEERAKSAREELEEMQKDEEGKTGPRDLVKIQNFDLPVRARDSQPINRYRGEAWKPEWDGRMNYKGFRRARDGGGPAPRRDKIIVPVVPWQGSGNRQYKDTESQRSQKTISQKSNRSKSSQSTRGSRRLRQDSDSEEEAGPIQVSDDEQVDPETARLQREAEEVLDHHIDITEPRQTRHAGSQTPSLTQSTANPDPARSAKRPASFTPKGRASTAKKQKFQQTVVIEDSDDAARNIDDDDDSDDDMKFSFGASRKARTRR